MDVRYMLYKNNTLRLVRTYPYDLSNKKDLRYPYGISVIKMLHNMGVSDLIMSVPSTKL
jgi:hypothetical protein